VKRGDTLLLVTMLVSFAADARADGFARFVSIPVRPPFGFEWVKHGSLALLALANILLFVRRGSRSWLVTALSVPIALGVFTWIFRDGSERVLLNYAPPPLKGVPSPVFWGWGWRQVGFAFARWNLVGLCFLLVCVAPVAWYHRFTTCKKAALVLAVNAGAYALCLTPYIAAGALTHGWHGGGHVFTDCRFKICAIVSATATYARDHEGRLPRGRSIEDVLRHCPSPQQWYRSYNYGPAYVCPAGAARERMPLPYLWNAEMSGKPIGQALRLLRNGGFLVECPYHRRSWDMQWLHDAQVWTLWEYEDDTE